MVMIETSCIIKKKHQVKPQHLTTLQIGFHLGVERGKSSQSCIEVLCKIITATQATNSICSYKKNHASGFASLVEPRNQA
jgi:hypothetical protein